MTPGGRRRRESRRGDLPLTADINVTSLIDVAFTLLVIFIITAPALQGGIEVRLPRGQIQPVTAQDRPLIVSVDADGRIFVGETEVSGEEFRTAFPQLFRAAETSRVYLQGDEAAPHGTMYFIYTVLNRIMAEEGGTWAILGEPEPQPRD